MTKKNGHNEIKVSKLVYVGAFLLLVIIILRVAQVSLSKKIDGVDLQELASRRTTKTEILPAKRGTIYSKDGEVLAQNVSSYKLIAYLSEKRTTNNEKPEHVVDKEKTAKELAPILMMPEEEILALLQKEKVYQTEFGSKGKGLSEITKEKIDALHLPGLDFIENQKRYYPKGNFLSYTIGYAKTVIKNEEENQEEIVGELGLEKQFDKELRGEDGYITYQKDLQGYKIPNASMVRKEAVPGKDIYLTIDSNIQFFTEQALTNSDNAYNFEWFTMMVADAKTGKILASTSTPSFDPNIRDMTNYLDYNTSITYEPGSTMKIYTYMAAMENNVYNGEETFLSGSYKTTDGTIIGDWNNKEGWGTINFDRGFAMSSNVGIVNLIDRHMDSKMLRQYFKKLGFGSKTGIEVPGEASGKLDFKYETEIFNAGFGQGITTTPIQNIQALTSLTNKGILLKPYMISKVVNPKNNDVLFEGRRKEIEKVASETTVSKILSLMDDTVNGRGTTGNGYHMDGYNLVGKTGTAQIANTDGSGYATAKDAIIASFAGIYPKENPEFIIYASVKKPESGLQKPIYQAVKEVITNISKYIGEDIGINKSPDLPLINTPSYINKDTNDVIRELNTYGINPIVLGSGKKVIKQYPIKGTNITAYDKVFLLTSSSDIVMPNIIGYSSKDVNTLCTLINLPLVKDGIGYVANQSIPPGTVLSSSSTLTVSLASKYYLKE